MGGKIDVDKLPSLLLNVSVEFKDAMRQNVCIVSLTSSHHPEPIRK